MTDYIEIRNWDRFQHADATKRGRDPVWIKTYTRILSDDAYLSLSGHRRAILHGLWLEYARSGRQLPLNTRSITRRIDLRVTMRDLEAIKTLGFIAFRQDTVTTPSIQEEKREEKNKPKAVTYLLDVRRAKDEADSLRESIEQELGRLRADG